VAAADRDEAALALRRSRSLAAIHGLPSTNTAELEIVDAPFPPSLPVSAASPPCC
jgi:hypothetical protein